MILKIKTNIFCCFLQRQNHNCCRKLYHIYVIYIKCSEVAENNLDKSLALSFEHENRDTEGFIPVCIKLYVSTCFYKKIWQIKSD